MIREVDPEEIERMPKRKKGTYRKIIDEFLRGDVEAAEILMPEMTEDNLYCGIYNVLRYWRDAPVRLMRRRSRVYLIRKRAVDAGTSNGPEQKGSV